MGWSALAAGWSTPQAAPALGVRPCDLAQPPPTCPDSFLVLAGGALGTIKNKRNLAAGSALASDSVFTVSLRTRLAVSEKYVATNRSPAVFTGPHD